MDKKAIAALLSIALIFLGYTKTDLGNLIPTPTPNVQVLPETFPVAPTDPSLQDTVAPLVTLISDKTDALILARMFRDWGDRLERPTKMESLADFQKAYMYSLQELLYKTQMEGKYQGQLATLFNNVFQDQLKFLFNTQGDVTSLALSPETVRALQKAMYAISWKLSTIALGTPNEVTP